MFCALSIRTGIPVSVLLDEDPLIIETCFQLLDEEKEANEK